MAGRPIKRRTAKSLLRDIETLSRLRGAIKIDRKLKPDLALKAIRELDTLVETLYDLHNSKDSSTRIPIVPDIHDRDSE